MNKCEKTAALYVASLKAIALVLQHCHWTTKGKSFYGDHLLFERLYNATLKDLDAAAEKFIGVLGAQCLDYQLQAQLLNRVLVKYKELSDKPVVMSLTVEKQFLKFSQDVYNCFEEEGELTLGLDDLIMEIANNHEGACYLLQQTLDHMNTTETSDEK